MFWTHFPITRGAGHEEGEKEGSKGLPGHNFYKCLLSLLPRHGVHRDAHMTTGDWSPDRQASADEQEQTSNYALHARKHI